MDPKSLARFAALTRWAEEAASGGHSVPDREHLEALALAKRTQEAKLIFPVVLAWAATLDWIMGQANFGVADPYLHLPEELRVPAVQNVPNPSEDIAIDEVSAASQEPIVEAEAAAPTAPTASAATKVAKDKAKSGTKNAQPKSGGSMTQWESTARADVKRAIESCIKPLSDLRARDANEGDTRMVVTDLLCEGLGYDKFKDLTTEYMVKQEFADYGVRIDKQLVAFVEVKRISQKLNERHLRQVQMYAVNEGVEWMILTNGAVWQVYHLTGGLPVVVNMVFEVDLLGQAPIEEKVEQMFLLHKEALKRRRIDESWRHRAATEPAALLDVLLSDAVIDQVRKEVKRRSGIAATADQLSELIKTEIVDPKLLAKLFKR